MTPTSITIVIFIGTGLLGIIGYLYSQLQREKENDINSISKKIDEMKKNMENRFDKIDESLNKYMTAEQVNNLIDTKTNLFKKILTKDVKSIIKQARGMKAQIRTTFASSLDIFAHLVYFASIGDVKSIKKTQKHFKRILDDNDKEVAKLMVEDDIEKLIDIFDTKVDNLI